MCSYSFPFLDLIPPAWSFTPLRISNGFETTFTYTLAPGALGFAFVLQTESNYARGGSSANLGYSFTRSVAIEFDIFQDGSDDSVIPHIELHTGYTGSNSPWRSSIPGAASPSNAKVPNPLSGTKTVTIKYQVATRTFEVIINGVVVTSQTVDSTLFASTFPEGIAYVGFTSSTSETRKDTVSITDWSFRSAGVNPSTSLPPTASSIIPSSVTAASSAEASTGSFSYAFRDTCGNIITVPSLEVHQTQITAELRSGSTPIPSSTLVTTDGKGGYDVKFWHTITGSYNLVLTINSNNGLTTTTRSYPVTIIPAQASASQSQILTSVSHFIAGETQTIQVRVRDIFGNDYTRNDASLTARFACCEHFNAVPSTTGIYSLLASTTTAAASTTLEVKLGGTSLPSSPLHISVNAAAIDAQQSYLTGSGLGRVTANVPSIISLVLRDRFGNIVDNAAPSSSSYSLFLYKDNPSTPIPGTTTTWIPPTGSERGYLQYNYNTTVAGTYRLQCWVNNALSICKDSASVQTTVDAGALAAPLTQVSAITPSVIVGQQAQVQIAPVDTWGNRRNSPNPSGSDFTATITTGSTSLQVTCTGQSPVTSTPNYIQSATCGYDLTGVYYTRFTPINASLPYTIQVALGVVQASTQAQITTSAGPAIASGTSFTLVTPSPYTANQTITLQHKSTDSYGNVAAGDSSGQFSYSVTRTSSGTMRTQPIVSGAKLSSAGTYTVELRIQDAGDYTISALLAGTAITSTPSLTIAPASFSPATSTILDPLVGVEGTSKTLRLQLRDALGNDLTTFVIGLTATVHTASGGTPTSATVSNGDVAGQMKIGYTIPAYGALAISYQLRIRTSSGDIVTGTDPAGTIARSGSSAYATATPSATTVRSNQMLQYTLVATDSTGTPLPAITDPFTVDFNDGTNSVPAQITPTTNGQATVTLVPKKAGVYRLRVYLGGHEIESSKNNLLPTITVTSSTLFPANCLVTGLRSQVDVGEGPWFIATLYDSERNLVTGSALSEASITATFERADTGAPLAVTPTITNLQDSRFNISFHATISGTLFVNVREVQTGSILGSANLPVKVTPGALSQLSTVTSPLSCTAGQSCILLFTARDSFNNLIEYTSNGQIPTNFIKINATNIDGSVPVQVRDPYAPGQYQVMYTPTIARSDVITISNGITNTAIVTTNVISIQPADDISLSTTTVTGLQDVFDVTSTIVFIIHGKDRYGNTWLNDPSRFDVALLDSLDQPTVIPASSKVSLGGGQIRITHRVEVSGVYRWRVRVGTIDFGISGTSSTVPGFVAITVQPGIAVATNTLQTRLQAPNDVLVAGTAQSITLTTRDRYNNIRTSSESSLVFSVDWYINQFTCSNGVPMATGTSTRTNNVNTTIRNNNDGTYTLIFNSTIANPVDVNGVRSRYYFVIRMNNVLIRPCELITDSIQVIPAETSASHSLLTGSAMSGAEAGQQLSLSLLFADRFGNPTGINNNEVVYIGEKLPASFPNADALNQLYDNAATTCLNQLGLPTGSIFNISQSHIAPGSGGSVVATVTANQAGRSLLLVTVNGTLVRPSECMTITISPSYPNTWSISIVDAAHVVAGIEAQFRIIAKDRFDNIINATALPSNSPSTQFSFTSSSSLVPSGNDPVTYRVTKSSQIQSPEGNHYLSLLLAWSGTYELRVQIIEPTTRPRSMLSLDTTLTVLPSLCAQRDVSKPHQCKDKSCVSSLTQCPEYQPNCPYKCGDPPVCRTNQADCACRAGERSCSASFGTFCINSTNACPSSIFPTSHTPASPRQCAPGELLCPDGFTCLPSTTATVASCPSRPVISTCQSGWFMCPSGACVKSIEDCGTATTCSNNTHIVCPDGSCAPSELECRTPPSCVSPLSLRCPDGSCRASYDDCPTLSTCPIGYIKCEGGTCASSLSSCPNTTAVACPLTMVRCPDGSCRQDFAFCPTPITCPFGLVLCPDGSCSESLFSCSMALSPCPSTLPVRCPSSHCAMSVDHCPTPISCPLTRPIRCSNNACVASQSQCTSASPTSNSPVSTPCPTSTPLRCSDGSCRATHEGCPTPIRCPASRPIKCEDHRCVATITECTSTQEQMTCPSDTVRCPSGNCARSFGECPTSLVCPPSQTRCIDGTCRVSCSISSLALTACPQGKVQCPDVHAGIVCASSLALCPSPRICPRHRPIRCMDASCAASVNECPTVDTSSIPSTRVACSGGTWASSPTLCGNSITCPPSTPIKCWDESCRVSADDCPPQRACPSNKPFLCSDGSCQLSLWSCSNSRCTDPDNQVRCPAYSSNRGCVSNTTQCLDVLDLSATVQIKCPFGQRCWDGSCSSELRLCPARNCPKHHPYLCQNGACAPSASTCPLPNGCPFDLPIFCATGSCAATALDCPSPNTFLNCTGSTPARCPDGSCRASSSDCATVGPYGCALNTAMVCHDKTCANLPSNIGSDTVTACSDTPDTHNACPASRPFRCPGGYCATSSTRCPLFDREEGICRSNSRILAAGFGPMTVTCDDGSCAYTLDQCPTIAPCPKGHYRCGDGSCKQLPYDPERANVRDDPTSAFNTQPNHGAPCSGVNTCPLSRPYRCQDGLCAARADLCIDDYPVVLDNCCAEGRAYNKPTPFSPYGTCGLTPTGCVPNKRNGESNQGCPYSTQRCTYGMCLPASPVSSNASSTPISPPTWLTCAHYDNAMVNASCPTDRPVKCSNGACVPSSTACPLPNGCMSTTPVLCSDGTCATSTSACSVSTSCPAATPVRCPNNHCVSNASLCLLNNGCPVTHPLRCVTGACARRPSSLTSSTLPTGSDPLLLASCPAAIVCDAYAPVLCADGRCAPTADQCRPVQPCADPCAIRCPSSGVCVKDPSGACPAPDTVLSLCPPTNSTTCPTSNPVLCPTGACVSSLSMCTSGLYDPLQTPSCPASSPIRCWDGKCAANYYECVKRTWDTFRSGLTPMTPADSVSDDGVICPGGGLPCPNGQCVDSIDQCPPLPACPNDHLRCADGLCIDLKSNPSATCSTFSLTLPACPAGSRRCEDGICRPKCPFYLGCPLSAPFSCSIKKVQCVASYATCHTSSLYQAFAAQLALKRSPTWSLTALRQSSPTSSVFAGRAASMFAARRHHRRTRASFTPTTRITALEPIIPSSSSPSIHTITTSISSASLSSPSITSSSPSEAFPTSDSTITTTTSSTLLALTDNVLPGQEVCAIDCERDVPAISQQQIIHPSSSHTLDISLRNGIPRSRLIVPSGVFTTPTTLSISPVPLALLDGAPTHGDNLPPFQLPLLPATAPQGEESLWNQKVSNPGFSLGAPGDFASKVLSTPFHCEFNSSLSKTPALPLTVTSYVDLATYTSSSGGSGGVTSGVSCEFLMSWDSATNPPSAPTTTCGGVTSFTSQSINLQMETCDTPMQFQGVFHSQTSRASWNGETSQQCLCFNFTQATVDAQRITNGLPSLMGKTFCVFAERTADMLTLGFHPGFPETVDVDLMSTCPSDTSHRTVIASRIFSSVTTDPCAQASQDTNQIDKVNICLAYYSRYGQWTCVYDRNGRIANPVWVEGMGTTEVSSPLPSCSEFAYAFASIPLPPAPQPEAPESCWWCDNGTTVIIVVSCVAGFIVILAVFVGVMLRKRAAYKKAAKEELELQNTARDLNEFAGGVGIGDRDGELKMVVNPLVFKLQELHKSLDKAKVDMDAKGQQEEAQIQQLRMQRKQIQAEITRVEAELKAQNGGSGMPVPQRDDSSTMLTTGGLRSSTMMPSSTGNPSSSSPTLGPSPSFIRSPTATGAGMLAPSSSFAVPGQATTLALAPARPPGSLVAPGRAPTKRNL